MESGELTAPTKYSHSPRRRLGAPVPDSLRTGAVFPHVIVPLLGFTVPTTYFRRHHLLGSRVDVRFLK